MPTPDWTDLIATDPEGESLGRVEDVYVEERTGRPEFVLLRQSRLGGLRHKSVLVPVHEAREEHGALLVPYTAAQVKDAPAVDGRETRLTPEFEDQVLTHFAETRRLAERAGDAATVVLSEERLHVGRRVVDHERVRIRKVIVTEEVTIKVRLRREELEVVSEPLGDGDGDARGRAGAGTGRELEDVADDLPPDMVLHAEEPVVTTTVVPREHVRFSRRVVTDRVTIEEPVRHEEAALTVDRPGLDAGPGRAEARTEPAPAPRR